MVAFASNGRKLGRVLEVEHDVDATFRAEVGRLPLESSTGFLHLYLHQHAITDAFLSEGI